MPIPQQSTQSHAAHQQLKQRILSGEFEPDYRLREVDIAQLLGIGRTPVREALKRLQDEGLLTYEAGRGLVVTTLDQQAVTELYAMREVLEGAAAAFAARHATAAEIANMDAILLEFENGRDPVAHNQAFHQAIYSAAHNRHLIRSLKSLTDSTFLLGRSTLATSSRADISHTEHCEMLDAIRSRDEDLARETAQNHIRHALLERLKLLRQNPAV
jgi:DNA-binding GntR family transcriptional regulator